MNIKLCMGSSCFVRGNTENLSFIEEYINKNNLSAKIDLSGCRCENCCSSGPNIFINGIKYSNVNPEEIKKIIESKIGEV